ncbi:MAG: ribosomal-processing cysteine protease Prp [Lachnospiraceae bacterium]|nr:ribosomal-processing cysteine protease Prp [Lachnospiraceae bacterium]
MIIARVIFDEDGDFFGLHVSGHAGYAQYGSDIICAAVSSLTLNSVNSILQYTDQGIVYETNEDGLLKFKFEDKPSHDVVLLFKSMILGLKGIEEQYGSEYLQVRFLQRFSKNVFRKYDYQEV